MRNSKSGNFESNTLIPPAKHTLSVLFRVKVSVPILICFIYDPLIARVLCTRGLAPLMSACCSTSFNLVCIPDLLGRFDFLKHRMMPRTLCLFQQS